MASKTLQSFNRINARFSALPQLPGQGLLPSTADRTQKAAMATLANFKVPQVDNEPNKHYAKGSPERAQLRAAVEAMKKQGPLEVPLVFGGKEIKGSAIRTQHNPASHATPVANFSNATPAQVSEAIEAASEAKASWESLPFADRAAIFLKAADLIAGKYRYEIMAATMVGQGKNAWQAEIDAAAELCDFLRFNVKYAEELYAQQPTHNSPGVWNRVEFRPLEGFVYAVTPFNFTAIAGNLPCAPALMGNVVIWKPSQAAIASNWVLYRILLEAGLPPNVIQFMPGDAQEVTKVVLDHPDFASLHYTGSTAVFRSLYGKIGEGVAKAKYRGYPRIVGETGGKNFHLVHPSADVSNAALHTVRGAFEYQGQKCSATSRCYVPKSLWPQFKQQLVAETQKLRVGAPEHPENFVGPVIHAASFQKLSATIDAAKADPDLDCLVGGTYDKSTGYFIHPTIYQARTPDHPLLKNELFGPILTVYVYDDDVPVSSPSSSSPTIPTPSPLPQEITPAFAAICRKIDTTTPYALTGSVFATSRPVLRYAEDALRNAAGNFYVNCKSTGAVVGQQPFGGARASGTNDKAGSPNLLGRFVSLRAVKEEFVPVKGVGYVSNEV
ncbi:MAG: 1-pyrroline-5-carboxylate dehydrogenase [Caeruleum heppii]|nr:MAG: 1-pyrroline-5-carboxylate dehydrogenase [Caeruleum heppii]